VYTSRSKSVLESSGCWTHPLETSGYRPQLFYEWYTSKSTLVSGAPPAQGKSTGNILSLFVVHLWILEFVTYMYLFLFSLFPSWRRDECCKCLVSGYCSRTWLRCSHMVVKTLLYCTRKRGCKGGCMSARSFLQPPRNGSTGQVPVLEHEKFSRAVVGTPRACTRCSYDSPREIFMFQDGDLTSWTVARWQKVACWR